MAKIGYKWEKIEKCDPKCACGQQDIMYVPEETPLGVDII